MQINLQVLGQRISFLLGNPFSNKDSRLLNDYVKQSYTLLKNSLDKINDHQINALFSHATKSDIKATIKDMMKRLEQVPSWKSNRFSFSGTNNSFKEESIKSIIFLRLKEYDKDPSVLASVDKDTLHIVKLYDNFFNLDDFKDDRAGVIIHELAHSVGLENEGEAFDIDSAESIKNLCLLANGKINLKQIYKENEESEQNSDSGEMTYRPNPNRDEKGRFDVGPDGNGNSSGNNSKKPSNSSHNNITAQSGYKSDSVSLYEVDKNRN